MHGHKNPPHERGALHWLWNKRYAKPWDPRTDVLGHVGIEQHVPSMCPAENDSFDDCVLITVRFMHRKRGKRDSYKR